MSGKIEAYKDSNGNIFDNEKDYIVSEVEIQHYNNIKMFEKLLEIVKSKPIYYYKILNNFSMHGNEAKKSDIEKEFNKHKNLIDKYEKIKHNRFSGNIDIEDGDSSNWNDSPGYWRGISAQDILGKYE